MTAALPKVFGIGLNKTGTKTLAAALSILGYRNATFNGQLMRQLAAGNVKPLIDYAAGFDSCEDWPWPLAYRQLAEAYPQARFILTVRRSAEAWYGSLERHARKTGATPWRKIAYGYTFPWENPEHHREFYRRHEREVAACFASQPERLLRLCWEDGDGWPQLCGFLGLPVPDRPFPHDNKEGDALWRFTKGAVRPADLPPDMPQKLAMVTLPVADLTRTRRFYEQGLGWLPRAALAEAVVYEAGGVLLAFKPGAAPVPGVALRHPATAPDEVRRIVEAARRVGATASSAPVEKDGRVLASFDDPDGYRWEVVG